MIVYGGDSHDDLPSSYDDLWQYFPTNSSWVKRNPGGHTPSGRFGHTLNVVNGATLLLFGGCHRMSSGGNSDFTYLNSLWMLKGPMGPWTEITNVTYEYSPELRKQLTKDDPPIPEEVAARRDHSSTSTSICVAKSSGPPGGIECSPLGSGPDMILFGGLRVQGRYMFSYRDVWKFNINTNVFTFLTALPDYHIPGICEPPRCNAAFRFGSSASVMVAPTGERISNDVRALEQSLVIFGGRAQNVALNDLWTMSLTSLDWTLRSNHTSITPPSSDASVEQAPQVSSMFGVFVMIAFVLLACTMFSFLAVSTCARCRHRSRQGNDVQSDVPGALGFIFQSRQSSNRRGLSAEAVSNMKVERYADLRQRLLEECPPSSASEESLDPGSTLPSVDQCGQPPTDYAIDVKVDSIDGGSQPNATSALAMPSNEVVDNNTICGICLCEYEADDRLRVLPCQHTFHCGCIDQWFQDSRFCPFCRCDVAEALAEPTRRRQNGQQSSLPASTAGQSSVQEIELAPMGRSIAPTSHADSGTSNVEAPADSSENLHRGQGRRQRAYLRLGDEGADSDVDDEEAGMGEGHVAPGGRLASVDCG